MDRAARERILSLFPASSEATVDQFMALAAKTVKTADPAFTGFLSGDEQELLRSVVGEYPDLRCIFFGGYRQADRKRAVVLPSFYISEHLEFPLSGLEMAVKGGGDSVLSKDQYAAAISSCGVTDDMVGDILVSSERAHAFVDPDAVSVLVSGLRSVADHSVTCRQIDTEQVDAPVERVQEMERTVASLRLDSVAAAAFSTSRSKMAKDIKAKKLKLNFELKTSPDEPVAKGDVLSITGRGKVVIDDVLGETKKGRLRLKLKKMV